jgi:hypothetical protein
MGMKEKIYYTIVGERYDNSMAVDLQLDEDDPESNDYFILDPMKNLTIYDVKQLRRIKELQSNAVRDNKLVQVLPFRDHMVDYSQLIFDMAYIFEPDEKYSPDGESVYIEMRHARVLKKTGVLFGIIPPEPVPGIHTLTVDDTRKRPDIEDEMESFYTYGPVEHEPDLPIYPKLTPPETVIKKRKVKEKPVFERKRRNVLTEPVM